MTMIPRIFLVAVILPGVIHLQGQDDKALLRDLVGDERDAVDALVLYPPETRTAIFEACMYPEVLVKMDKIQQKTHDTFMQYLESVPRETQESVWNLTRYPQCVDKITENGPKTKGALTAIAEAYPEEIRAAIVDMGLHQYPLLLQITQLNGEAGIAMDDILKGYPPEAQEAFRQLIALPEVLSLLTENIELAILTGDVYKRDPEWVVHKADSLSLVVAQENALELQDWQEGLQEDQQAENEFTSSAEDFAKESDSDDASYQYDDIYYDPGPDVYIKDQPYYYNYPYWFGYPYWYPYPRWRPYPYWWDWGFYYRPNHVIVIINLPSYYYMHWYFDHPEHHYHYPHLSSHFIKHYAYHPRPASSITVSVEQWRRTNKGVVSDDWVSKNISDQQRTERLKEFGEFEMDREKYNRARPEKQLDQVAYLEKNASKYPDLKPVRTVPEPSKQEPAQLPGKQVPARRVEPKKTQPDVQRQPADTRQTPANPPVKKQPSAEPRKDTTPKEGASEMDKAKTYHRNTWENSKPAEKAAPPPPPKAPARTAPAKKTEPKKRDSGG